MGDPVAHLRRLGFIGVPVSVVCGIVGLNMAKQGQGGRGMAIGGLALSGVWVPVAAGVFAFFFFGEGYFYYSAPTTGVSADGRSPASYFKAGDCFAKFTEGVQEVAVVDCDEPHAAEVIAVFMLPDGDFPGKAAIDEYKCKPELATYAPAATNDPSVRVLKRYPDEKSWALGDRSVTCIAALDPPRTGSLKG